MPFPPIAHQSPCNKRETINAPALPGDFLMCSEVLTDNLCISDDLSHVFLLHSYPYDVL